MKGQHLNKTTSLFKWKVRMNNVQEICARITKQKLPEYIRQYKAISAKYPKLEESKTFFKDTATAIHRQLSYDVEQAVKGQKNQLPLELIKIIQQTIAVLLVEDGLKEWNITDLDLDNQND